jgi:hypothetical protein
VSVYGEGWLKGLGVICGDDVMKVIVSVLLCERKRGGASMISCKQGIHPQTQRQRHADTDRETERETHTHSQTHAHSHTPIF